MTGSTKVLIAGPPKSGKTCLLGAAHLEGNLSAFNDDIRCNLIPRNRSMISLLERARRTILSGRLDQIDATIQTTDYVFDLRVSQINHARKVFGSTRLSSLTRFVFLDGPGGALLPGEGVLEDTDHDEVIQFRQTLIEHAAQSTGLLLCIDAENEQLARSFFIHLPSLLAEIDSEISSNAQLPFTRVAILLTKSDKYFLKRGLDAQRIARQTDPWERAVELLTRNALGGLLNFVKDETTLACGWSSAYGFIPADGTANYDEEHDRLRTYDPIKACAPIDSWSPHRVLDPFVFLATGDSSSMVSFRKDELSEWLKTYCR